jgi:uncharacterized cupredoxin-like copper-binding protein
MRRLFSLAGPVSLALIVLAAAACSENGRTAAAPRTLVKVGERDFQISVTPNRVNPGVVRLIVRNRGPDTHELIVVRSRTQLPLRLDGLTVNEKALNPPTVASLDGAGPGTVRQLQLRLPKGRYEFFCNMAGHFMAGMHAELVVD